MRKTLVFILSILILSVLGHFSFPRAFAIITFSQQPNPAYRNSGSIIFTLTSDKGEIKDDQNYTFAAWKPGIKKGDITFFKSVKPKNNIFQVKMTLFGPGDPLGIPGTPGTWEYKFALGGDVNSAFKNGLLLTGQFFIYGCDKDSAGCPSLAVLQKTFEAHTQIPFFIVNAQKDQKYGVWFEPDRIIKAYEISDDPDLTTNGFPSVKRFIDSGDSSPDLKRLCITQNVPLFGLTIFGSSCDFSIPDIKIVPGHVDLVPDNNNPILSNRPGVPDPNIPPEVSVPILPVPLPPCARWADLNGKPFPTDATNKQILPPEPTPKKCIAVNTALLEISTEPFGFVKSIMGIVLGVAGGIAVILIIAAGFSLMTSQGNHEVIQDARARIIAAIAGLLFIIFSVAILEIIGVDILHIPGFGK